MKKLLYSIAIISVIVVAACSKENDGSCNLPATAVPGNVVGEWVNGYTNFTQIRDAYNGKYLGNTWQSARYLKLAADGKRAEMFIFGGSQYAEFATKCEGNVVFDEEQGIFQFNVCKAWYKGWQNGSMTVNRAATKSECEDMTDNFVFYYDFATSGGITYLQLFFEQGGSPTSFRRAD